jgi:FMN phosphatase YigB (HAD superfamily)
MDNHKPLILFDVGNVLVKLDFLAAGEKAAILSQGRLTPEEFLGKYCERGLDHSYITGKIGDEELILGLEEIVGKVSHDELRKLAVIHHAGVISDMVRLKEDLIENGSSVGIFSNTGPLHYLDILTRFPEVYSSANPLVLSFLNHTSKPDRKMYELVNHSNVIYIDDSDTYVSRGVNEFGWMGIVYKACIDLNEPQRRRDETTSFNNQLRVAKSALEVRSHLEELGVKF